MSMVDKANMKDMTIPELIAKFRDKYTVHDCDECDLRKCCERDFDSDECKGVRKSIRLLFGIEDGTFAELLNLIEAAEKNTVPARLVVSTVRALLEGRTKEEKDNAVLELSRHFDRNGKWQLGCYVRAMAQLEPTWVPMEGGE